MRPSIYWGPMTSKNFCAPTSDFEQQCVMTHFLEGSFLRCQIIDGVSWNPDHGWERHDESYDVGPSGVLDVTILDGGPAEQVEAEDELKKGGENRSSINNVFASVCGKVHYSESCQNATGKPRWYQNRLLMHTWTKIRLNPTWVYLESKGAMRTPSIRAFNSSPHLICL